MRQATAADNQEERAATPPPDERNFVDDDGTAYQWDAAQRRFVEMGAPAPSYGVEEMTFAVEPDVIPAIPRRQVCCKQRCAAQHGSEDIALLACISTHVGATQNCLATNPASDRKCEDAKQR